MRRTPSMVPCEFLAAWMIRGDRSLQGMGPLKLRMMSHDDHGFWPPTEEPLILSSTFRTFDTCHCPPRRVSMPRSLSAAAMPRSDVIPCRRKSSTTGARSHACWSAFRETVSLSAAPPFPARLSAAAPLGLPSLTPRAFATASAFSCAVRSLRALPRPPAP